MRNADARTQADVVEGRSKVQSEAEECENGNVLGVYTATVGEGDGETKTSSAASRGKEWATPEGEIKQRKGEERFAQCVTKKQKDDYDCG